MGKGELNLKLASECIYMLENVLFNTNLTFLSKQYSNQPITKCMLSNSCKDARVASTEEEAVLSCKYCVTMLQVLRGKQY